MGGSVSDWYALRRELDIWAEAGRVATFWWRDDDMAAPCSELSEVLALSAAHGVPLALAAIPARLDGRLTAELAHQPQATVLQHGYAHIDHAPAGAGSWEHGPHRPRAVMAAELARGRDLLAELFGRQFLAVLAPPWGKIDPALLPDLARLGYHGLTRFWPRRGRVGLPEVNAHAAVSDWKPEARFAGADNVIYDLLLHLRQRRRGLADPTEPTGLSTHHWTHEPATIAFLDRLFAVTGRHPAARWIDIRTAIAEARATERAA